MEATDDKHESSLGAILGWGSLALFAIGFAWYVGAPLIIGERWADKKTDAIQMVRDSKPLGNDTLYDMIRAFSLKAKEKDVFIGEFSWDAIQQDGPEYQVTLLWTEATERKVAVDRHHQLRRSFSYSTAPAWRLQDRDRGARI